MWRTAECWPSTQGAGLSPQYFLKPGAVLLRIPALSCEVEGIREPENKSKQGWGMGKSVESLPGMQEALGSSPSPA